MREVPLISDSAKPNPIFQTAYEAQLFSGLRSCFGNTCPDPLAVEEAFVSQKGVASANRLRRI